MYYVLLRSMEERTRLINKLAEHGIKAVFHYIPLHSSPAGMRFGRSAGAMPHTDRTSDTLLRLPLYYDLGKKAAGRCCGPASGWRELNHDENLPGQRV